MKILFRSSWVALLIAATFFVLSACAPTAAKKEEAPPPAKEEPKAEAAAPAKAEEPAAAAEEPAAAAEEAAPAAPAAMKWESDADGKWADGSFERTNAPAMTLDTPEDFELKALTGSNVFDGAGPGGLPSLQVVISKVVGDDIEAFLQGYAATYSKALEALGTDVQILKNEPTDRYEDFRAQNFEVEWKFGGSTLLNTTVDVIIKDGYYIQLGGHTMGDLDPLFAIFESIDLDP